MKADQMAILALAGHHPLWLISHGTLLALTSAHVL